MYDYKLISSINLLIANSIAGEVFRSPVLQPVLHGRLHRGGDARRHHQRRRRRARVQVGPQVCDIQVRVHVH